MAFLSVLASYLLVFVVFVVVIIAAVFLGIGIYKLIHKNKMQEVSEEIITTEAEEHAAEDNL